MRALALALSCLPLLAGPVLAGPMPALPDLPPLPSGYDNVGTSGWYAGLLGGFETGAGIEDGFEAAIVIGNMVVAADILLGVELMATADEHGGGALEASARVGAPVGGSLGVFASAGLGYDFDRDGFAVIGLGAEADLGNDWALRADYRLNIDLNDEPVSHRVLIGFVKRF
ncbi:MAG TPA: hypothetical protein VGB81_00700 [Devosia sp.]